MTKDVRRQQIDETVLRMQQQGWTHTGTMQIGGNRYRLTFVCGLVRR